MPRTRWPTPSARSSIPGFYPYDDLVRRATNLGLGIIITITGDAPRWATEGGLGNTFETANRRVDREASTRSSRPRS